MAYLYNKKLTLIYPIVLTVILTFITNNIRFMSQTMIDLTWRHLACLKIYSILHNLFSKFKNSIWLDMLFENNTLYTTYRTMFSFIKVSFINITCEIHVPFHNIMLYKKVQTVKRIKAHGYISSVLNLSVIVQNRCNFGNGDIIS